MVEKPTYLGLLNAVANAECRAHAYLTAWADVTPAAAVGGEVLVSVSSLGQDGLGGRYTLGEQRDLTLKGIAEPVPVVSIGWD